jgi:hypothetical protein
MKLHTLTCSRARRSAILTLSVALAAGAAAPALAESVNVTSQAHDVDAQFLIGTPVAAPATICLVDTGVNNTTPDTVRVVDRSALSGPIDDTSPTLHGTSMAMFMAAPHDDYGMVGLWPAARIVSVRASAGSEDAFTTAGFINGVKRCDAMSTAYGIRVIELALSSSDPLGTDEAAALADAIAHARVDGIAVVTAAGNANGGPLGVPANLPGVLSVGAADASGQLCAFSAVGAALLAPGCGIDGANPATGAPSQTMQGTSESSAIVAAATAALLSYRPDLSPDGAIGTLTTTAAMTAAGRRLNVAAAFRSAGLADVVDRGSALVPPTAGVAAPASAPSVPDVTLRRARRLPRPHLTIHALRVGHRLRLTVSATNRPRGVVLRVRVFAAPRTEFTGAILTRTSPRARVRVRTAGWTHLSAQFIDPSHVRASSRVTTVWSGRLRSSR